MIIYHVNPNLYKFSCTILVMVLLMHQMIKAPIITHYPIKIVKIIVHKSSEYLRYINPQNTQEKQKKNIFLLGRQASVSVFWYVPVTHEHTFGVPIHSESTVLQSVFKEQELPNSFTVKITS